MALGFNWALDRLRAGDAAVANQMLDRSGVWNERASQAVDQLGNRVYEDALTQEAASMAPRVQKILSRGPSGEDPSIGEARDTLRKVIYANSPAPESYNKEADQQFLLNRLSEIGVGSRVPQESASDWMNQFQAALADAEMARRNPGGPQRFMASLNQKLAESRLARTGLYSGITAGGVMGASALTPAAQELLALAGFLQEGEETARKSEDSPLNRA